MINIKRFHGLLNDSVLTDDLQRVYRGYNSAVIAVLQRKKREE
jgi:hypothetical protein